MMRIHVPAPLVQESGAEVTMAQFVRQSVESCEMFGKGIANIRRGDRILTAVEKLNGADSLLLENDDYNALKDAATNVVGWAPRYARLALPFFDALEKAEDVKESSR